MNFKRILSTALMVVMVFSAIVCAFPMSASAAYIGSTSNTGSIIPEGSFEANLTDEELATYLGNTTESANKSDSYLNYNFSTASEMLGYELSKGLLYCTTSKDGQYTLYVNKYTGYVYYVNNLTGQILTSNPTDPGYLNANGTISVQKDQRMDIMSQITVSFHESANSLNSYIFTSYEQAALRGQIKVSPISGGFRVNYTLGDTTTRYLLPGYISERSFLDNIFIPLAEKYEAALEQYCSADAPDENFSFFENEDYIPYTELNHLNTSGIASRKGYMYYIKQTQTVYTKILKPGSPEREDLDRLRNAIAQLFQYYALKAPDSVADAAREKMYQDYPITKEGISIYVFVTSVDDEAVKNSIKNYVSNIIKSNCPGYTYAMMYEDEAECLYVDNSPAKPVIRCALEYTFNADGTLSVRLPANSITFDDTRYTFETITPLKFFGTGNMANDGYIFYPDGSGAIVNFKDFYDVAANKLVSLVVSSDVYGTDYCYSEIDGAFREPITMPVYGIVNDVNANPVSSDITGTSSVKNGFFAIMEEGSALALLGYESKGNTHKYAAAFASYTPYPSDEYDLSETIQISTGSLGTYTMVSESKYTGSYVTRYVMLNDEKLGDTVYGAGNHYKSDYVGMASYYRDYLEANGVIKALETASNDLPLYLEAFGAMDILDRFLTIPVTKSIPLTTFDDVAEMYRQLSECTAYINELVSKYEKLVAEETDEVQKLQYQQTLDRYKSLVGEIVDIKNINFRLTGFANGGMSSTYPAKVKWQRSTGGKSGFVNLVTKANEVSANEGSTFGIYPDFDFMYLNKTAMFDGFSSRGNVSRMVDNRYASKQVYNHIDNDFETFFTLVISPDALDRFYTKFLRSYSRYEVNGLSVSTIGSDLNSNFDEKNPINREQARNYVMSILDRMTDEKNENSYDVMVDVGNIYTVQYASHILNVSTDSSHLRYASYTVPFYGLVLHSYVNYTGEPLNYSGNPDYDLLRSIENGASLYYIVCYQNTAKMKDDEGLNKYYGVDYHNWYDSIVTTYHDLNSAIGALQNYKITDHKFLISERVIDADETAENYVRLKAELVEMLDAQIERAVDAKLSELAAGGAANYSKRIKLTVDRAALIAQFVDILNTPADQLDTGDFKAQIDAIVADYEAEYAGAENTADNVEVTFSQVDYVSKYSYITDSFAQDADYVRTRYTVDNGNVSMVTYKNGDHEVKFILNYNLYSVTVKLDAEHSYTIEPNKFVKIG